MQTTSTGEGTAGTRRANKGNRAHASLVECVMHRTFESETTSGDFSPSLDPFAERSHSYAHTHFSNSPRERQYKIESISLEIYVRHIQVRYNNILYG